MNTGAIVASSIGIVGAGVAMGVGIQRAVDKSTDGPGANIAVALTGGALLSTLPMVSRRISSGNLPASIGVALLGGVATGATVSALVSQAMTR